VKGDDVAEFWAVKADAVDHCVTDNTRIMNQPLPQTVMESLSIL
jgi:hypothetical protein